MKTPIEAFAPAKINLTLHVTGQRADGYHLLDSLVMFADVGDRLSIAPDDRLTLDVSGPMAATLGGVSDNLVLRAARLMGQTARIGLEKHLPTAAGLGGGSSDAAATLRGLARLSGQALPDEVLSLGADVPACLLARALRMGGIGERVQPLAAVPSVHAVLANCGVALSTPRVFAALAEKTNPPMGPIPGDWGGALGFCRWLAMQRNDLEAPARAIAPQIDAVLSALSHLPGSQLSRMSGSGATCFALFATRAEADDGAALLARQRGEWWVRSASLG